MIVNHSRWDVDDYAISEWDENGDVSVDDVLGRLRYWASGKQGEPESIRDIEFIVELVHEIEQLQTDLIEAHKFANDAIETSMALAWNAWRMK